MATEFESSMAHIVASIRSAGYDPYAQLYGYLAESDETYITRTGGARDIVKALNKNELRRYVDTLWDMK